MNSRLAVDNVDYDKIGWTVYEDALCVCTSAKAGDIRTAGGIKPVMILTLFDDANLREMVLFINAKKTKGGNLAVTHDGKFARLYRLTIGENPLPRFSKAKQLLKKFVGHEFRCKFSDALDSHEKHYFKVTEIEPVQIKTGEQWFTDGRLRRKNTNQLDGFRKSNGNELATSWIKAGNELEIEKPVNVCHSLLDESKAVHKKISRNGVSSLKHDSYTPKDKDNLGQEKLTPTSSVNYFTQEADESYDDYLHRVIDATW